MPLLVKNIHWLVGDNIRYSAREMTGMKSENRNPYHRKYGLALFTKYISLTIYWVHMLEPYKTTVLIFESRRIILLLSKIVEQFTVVPILNRHYSELRYYQAYILLNIIYIHVHVLPFLQLWNSNITYIKFKSTWNFAYIHFCNFGENCERTGIAAFEIKCLRSGK